MPVCGDCKTCGSETVDYVCLRCEMRKCEQLEQALEAMTAERDALKAELDEERARGHCRECGYETGTIIVSDMHRQRQQCGTKKGD